MGSHQLCGWSVNNGHGCNSKTNSRDRREGGPGLAWRTPTLNGQAEEDVPIMAGQGVVAGRGEGVGRVLCH